MLTAPAPPTIAASGPLPGIARALTRRLQLVFPPERFAHATMPARLTPKDWTALTRRTPFVGLGWVAVEGDRDNGRLFRGEVSWSVYLVTKNAGGIAPRYHGDALAPGLFQMVQAAVGILHGAGLTDADSDLVWGTAMVRRAGNLFAENWEDDAAIAGIDVDVQIALPVAESVDLATADILATLGIDWQFADGGDAPDVIHLEKT
jgi:hypothetical protein